jgi:hypothetical protein
LQDWLCGSCDVAVCDLSRLIIRVVIFWRRGHRSIRAWYMIPRTVKSTGIWRRVVIVFVFDLEYFSRLILVILRVYHRRLRYGGSGNRKCFSVGWVFAVMTWSGCIAIKPLEVSRKGTPSSV